eukprot:gene12910-biopygen23006
MMFRPAGAGRPADNSLRKETRGQGGRAEWCAVALVVQRERPCLHAAAAPLLSAPHPAHGAGWSDAAWQVRAAAKTIENYRKRSETTENYSHSDAAAMYCKSSTSRPCLSAKCTMRRGSSSCTGCRTYLTTRRSENGTTLSARSVSAPLYSIDSKGVDPSPVRGPLPRGVY